MESTSLFSARIYKEYVGGMENLRNTFYISFLAVAALNHRPLDNSFSLQSFEKPGVIDVGQINRLGEDSIIEYVNSIRRYTINDIMLLYEYFASKMIVSMNVGYYSGPGWNNDKRNYTKDFEEELGLFDASELTFIQQARRLRNSIVHYNGVYNKANVLDYTFLNMKYYSVGHEGENITIDFESLMYLYHRVYEIVTNVYTRFIKKYCIDNN